MQRKSSVSHKVLPLTIKHKKPEVPTIKLLPKLRNTAKVLPDLTDSTTSNSKSASFILPARSSKKTSSAIVRSRDQFTDISDSLCYEEYKKAEIMRSRKILESKYPYWFIDSFKELDLSRSLRPQMQNGPEAFNSHLNQGLKNWNTVISK